MGGAVGVPRRLPPGRGRARVRSRRRPDAALPRGQVGGAAGAAAGVLRGAIVGGRPARMRGDDDRYQLLDTMREFGAKRLAAADAARLRRGHRDYYLGLAEAAAAEAMGAEQAAWLSRLGAETANLRAALGYSFSEQGEAAAGLRMTRLLRSYWLMTGQFTEGRHWHELAVATAPGSADNAWAVFGSGVLAVLQGDLGSGGPLLSAAARLAADAADADLAAHVTDARGAVAFYSGDLQTARDCHQAAIGAFERHGLGTRPPWSPTPGSPRYACSPATRTGRSRCARNACAAARRPASSGRAVARCGCAARRAWLAASTPPRSRICSPVCGSRSASATCARSRCPLTCWLSAWWGPAKRRATTSVPPCCTARERRCGRC